MKIFLSWSGHRSKAMAAAMRDWLPHVIQVADPFFSPQDIGSGEFWDAKLRAEINASKFGIICVTQENVEAPWLNYEAGALAEGLEGHTAPWLLGMTPEALKSTPMSRLQARLADREGTKAIVESIALRLESAIPPSIISAAADTHWEKLEQRLRDIAPPTKAAPAVSQEDLLQEILRNSQRILELQSRRDEDVARQVLFSHLERGDAVRRPAWHPGVIESQAEPVVKAPVAAVANVAPAGVRSQARVGAPRVVQDPKPEE